MNLFPNTNFHSLNLDWIVEKIRKAVFTINGQGPDENGNINLGGVAGVTSVNGVGPDSAGNVTLDPADVGALPDSYTAPVASVNGQTGNVQLIAADVNAMPNTYQAPVASVNGQRGAVVLDASDVGALPDSYTAPVVNVNGQTGSVELNASDVGALPDDTVIPSRTSQLVNDSGFITSQQASAVTSVNGKVGAVVLDASDVSALPDTTVVPTLTSQLVNDSGFITQSQAAPVASVNGKVGAVVLDSSDVGATPAGQGIPAGGTTGQVLTKTSAGDYAAGWQDIGWDVLWTNPATSPSDFLGQTVSVAWENYASIVVGFDYAYDVNGNDVIYTEEFFPSVNAQLPYHSTQRFVLNARQRGSAYAQREVYFESGGIRFGSGHVNGDWGSSANIVAVPMFIIGRRI